MKDAIGMLYEGLVDITNNSKKWIASLNCQIGRGGDTSSNILSDSLGFLFVGFVIDWQVHHMCQVSIELY
jgi:hypothetical protein